MVAKQSDDKSIPVKPSSAHRRAGGNRILWTLLVAIVGLLGYFQFIGRVDTRLTEEIVQRLRKEFPQHYVSVDRARLLTGQSITIDGLRIAKPTDQGLRDIVRVGRLVCNGPFDVVGLAQGQLPLESVVIDSADVSLWPLSNGRWNVEEFPSGGAKSFRLPLVEIRSGMIRIGHETGANRSEIICHDLRASLSHASVETGGPEAMEWRASVASSYFQQVQVQGFSTPDFSTWNANGSVAGLEFSGRLMDQLPVVLRERLAAIKGFAGEADGAFRVSMKDAALQVDARARLRNGRLLHPLVPYPLEALGCDVVLRNQLLQVRTGSAQSGNTRVEFDGDMHGLTAGSPLTASVRIQDLNLDDRLYSALPANIQEHWRRMRVSGLVDASAAIAFDGQRWKPRVLVRAKDGGIDPDFFPYPVRGIQGDFLYDEGRISAPRLTGIAGQQSISGSLTLQQHQPRWLMDLVLAADGPIAIDETLLNALTPRGATTSGFQRFISTLHPSGTVLLRRGRFIRSADRPDSISRSLELTFSECTIKYDGFRYPVYDVHGQATLDNDHLILREFIGRNDGARIKGEGFAQCRDSNLESIDLLFDAFNISLDEELQQALPASARNLWDQLQPAGTMDRVGIQIKRKDRNDPLDLRVEMNEVREIQSSSSRGISLRPLAFPYVIDDVQCAIDFRPGRIDIRSLSGKHDASRIQTEGQIRLHTDGSWDGQLSWLPSTRFVVDQVLLACLPQVLRQPLTRIQFEGPVSITGSTRVASLDDSNPSLVRSWNLRIDLEEAKFASDRVNGIRGSVDVQGENTQNGPVAFGSLAIDAMAIEGIAVTGIQGPFALDHAELMLGRDAVDWQWKNHQWLQHANAIATNTDPNVVPASFRSRIRDAWVEPKPELPRVPGLPASPEEIPSLDIRDNDVRARALSGTIFVSGVQPLNGERSRYRLRLVDSDFHGFLLDLGETHTQASGRLSVQVDVAGSWANTDALEGTGRAWLREANLYELPNMIRLFRLLSVRPDQGAFDSADIAFSIDGDRIPVNELQLDGDLVSMRGSGWVNLRREVYFDLFAHVGRKSIVGAITRPITQHRAANLMRIEVTGTTSDPQMRRSVPLMNSFEPVLSDPP
ncbi:MAG: AsmA-like C-terminal region-containing protein [Planctomycetota bacterium]